jgi:hypothetical protein
MKLIHNLIIIFLCTMLLGFFANFAQNDYGSLIIGLSLLAISTLLFAKTFILIKHQKIWRWAIVLSYILILISFLAINILQETSFLLVLFSIIFPTTFLPIIIYFIERKQTIKTNFFEYFFTFCIALFSLGMYFKIFHLSGGAAIRVWFLVLVFPMLLRIFQLIKQCIKEKTSSPILSILFSLFLAVWIIGFSFKLQHWPWANNILFSSYILLFLLVVAILVVAKNGEKFLWFSSQIWIAKTAFVCFLVITFYYNLSRVNLAPQLYSNEFPAALEELFSKSNSITPEGKKNQRKADVYREYYYTFLDNLEKEKK